MDCGVVLKEGPAVDAIRAPHAGLDAPGNHTNENLANEVRHGLTVPIHTKRPLIRIEDLQMLKGV